MKTNFISILFSQILKYLPFDSMSFRNRSESENSYNHGTFRMNFQSTIPFIRVRL